MSLHTSTLPSCNKWKVLLKMDIYLTFNLLIFIIFILIQVSDTLFEATIAIFHGVTANVFKLLIFSQLYLYFKKGHLYLLSTILLYEI